MKCFNELNAHTIQQDKHMTTLVFKSFHGFSLREDKTVNGVGEEFAQYHPNFEEQNQTNKGCWNCYESSNCTNSTDLFKCSGCSDCQNCSDCHGCSNCVMSDSSTGCSGCYNVTTCSGCSNCKECIICTGCSDCYQAINQTGLSGYSGQQPL